MIFTFKRTFFFSILIILSPLCTASECPTELDFGMQQESPLCNVPREIVQHIVSFLPDAYLPNQVLKRIRLSCKFLHNTAVIPGRIIDIYARDGYGTTRESLNFLFLCVVTAVKRQAGNSIRLYLGALQDNDDMDALKEFLRRCSRPDIAPYIKSLDIGYKDLPYIPDEISGLTALNRLCIDGNKVGTFERIMPIMSLQQLTFLAINGMDLERLDPKILSLSKLECLCMGFNRLKREDLELAIQLPNLQSIYFPKNLIKQEDVDYLKRKYPSLEKLLSFSIL